MMIDAGIEEELRQKLWTDAANMAADLVNNLVRNKNNKNAYELFYKKTESQICFLPERIWRSEIHPEERQGNKKQDQ